MKKNLRSKRSNSSKIRSELHESSPSNEDFDGNKESSDYWTENEVRRANGKPYKDGSGRIK